MASIYDGNSNCLECGRLVAPLSGLIGASPKSVFCCRKCLRSYYDSQPGSWEVEENNYKLLEEHNEELQRSLEEENFRINEENRRRLEEEYQKQKQLKFQDFQRMCLYFIGFTFLLLLLRSCH